MSTDSSYSKSNNDFDEASSGNKIPDLLNEGLSRGTDSEGSTSHSNQKPSKKHEEIFKKFQALRTEQRNLANKLSTLEMDLNEHRVVIITLKDARPERKCFRMIGGVLVEKTVKEVLPILKSNVEQLIKVIEVLTKNLCDKGDEINKYKEQHNIRIRGNEDSGDESMSTSGTSTSGTNTGKRNVLVM